MDGTPGTHNHNFNKQRRGCRRVSAPRRALPGDAEHLSFGHTFNREGRTYG